MSSAPVAAAPVDLVILTADFIAFRLVFWGNENTVFICVGRVCFIYPLVGVVVLG